MTAPVACDVSRLDCPGGVVTTAGIDGVSLTNGAWCTANWDVALGMVMRGDDIVVPGADWVLARDRYIDRLDASLQMVFDGNVDVNGVTFGPDTVEFGLEANRRTFLSDVVTPPDAPATRTLTLTMADTTALSGPVHVEEFRWGRGTHPGLASAVLRISLPQGLAEVTS